WNQKAKKIKLKDDQVQELVGFESHDRVTQAQLKEIERALLSATSKEKRFSSAKPGMIIDALRDEFGVALVQKEEMGFTWGEFQRLDYHLKVQRAQQMARRNPLLMRAPNSNIDPVDWGFIQVPATQAELWRQYEKWCGKFIASLVKVDVENLINYIKEPG